MADKTAAETYAEGQWAWGTKNVAWNDEHNGDRILVVWRRNAWHGVEVGNVWAESQIADVRLVDSPADAVRRVAPDQDAIAEVLVEHTRQTLEGRCSCGHTVPLGYSFVKHQAAALLASGVLGVPAVQRTADRETIADAVATVFDDGTFDGAHRDHHLRAADAVLAVLVPADQVRAEALAEVAMVASGLSSVFLHWRDRLEGWMSAPPFKGNPFRNGAAAFERAAGLARDLGAGKLNTEELDRLAHFGEDGPCTGYDYRKVAGA